MFIASSTPPPPRTLSATEVRPQAQTPRRGARVTQRELGSLRVFSNARDGVAIGSSQEGGGVDFAALTTDGGRGWRVGSPALWTASADAPDAVSSVTAIGRRTDVIYGPENITVTSNGGRSWYRVFPSGTVSAVVAGTQGIAAYDQITNVAGRVVETVQYVSRDGGRHWRLSDAPGG